MHASSSFLSETENCVLENNFIASLQQPEAMQTMVLQDILRRASGTEFGRQNDFGSIKGPKDYTQRIPLSNWADLTVFSQRWAAGEKDLLFPGSAVHFLQTSGSTGQNKWVPQSATGAEINRLVTQLRTYYRQASVVGEATILPTSGKVLLLSGQRQLATSSGGIPVGFASGVTAASAPAKLKNWHACPTWVYGVKDRVKRDFLLLRYALAEPHLVAAMGNNPRRFAALLEHAKAQAPQLVEGIRCGNLGCPPGGDIPAVTLLPNPARAAFLANLQEQGCFLPKYYWPHFNMACFWLGGPMAPAIRQISSLLPEKTLFFDAGYGASELKINIPMAPGSPYAPLALFAGYFEFLPEDGGPAVPCWQLQDGKIYEIVLTTYSGLYRHRLGDLIRVEGFVHNTPNIAFYSRVEEAANLAGEKTAVPLLLAAAEAASHALGAQLTGFALWPHAAEGHYHCYYEYCAPAMDDNGCWANAFDHALQTFSVGYSRRRQDGSLKPPMATQMPHGWEISRLEATHASGQGKSPIILSRKIDLA